MRNLLAIAVLSLVLPTVAVADPAPDVQKMTASDCERARKQNKTCVLTIEEETVEGGRPSAGESTVVVNPFADHASLITLRRDFIPEILMSAEDL
jgi:hypothetical protein